MFLRKTGERIYNSEFPLQPTKISIKKSLKRDKTNMFPNIKKVLHTENI